MSALQALAHAFFSPVRGRYHYLSMGKKNFRGYLQGDEVCFKKYLYVLRPLLAVRWIDSEKGMPPMRFADLVAGTVTDVVLLAEINELLLSKRAWERLSWDHAGLRFTVSSKLCGAKRRSALFRSVQKEMSPCSMPFCSVWC
ncbi:DNA polymerase beta superfamily protein [Burkholderia sp. Leaf177]|uniref:DNA polymerase beta superfamily protein n=1 Tax=Burkholderia sp. Leaf177 TaxID=1736287 RepID=UPI00190FE11B|nr:nucleotidyltransferase domain-containing protein [Burkholderia sp. Leaf177]